jgi:hypothetical protein
MIFFGKLDVFLMIKIIVIKLLVDHQIVNIMQYISNVKFTVIQYMQLLKAIKYNQTYQQGGFLRICEFNAGRLQ